MYVHYVPVSLSTSLNFKIQNKLSNVSILTLIYYNYAT